MLPACSGFVWFDCLDASVGNSSVELCPNTNSTWEVCKPLTSVNATRPFRWEPLSLLQPQFCCLKSV